ncbi:MAG: regulatory protein RecX [bacterium]|nr:regulatory protein RecX [bacterium]
MLTRRDHSRQEISRKLLEQGGQADLVVALLDELVERGLQSDIRFAEVFVRSRAERGCGPRSIMADLRSRGVDSELVEAALQASPYDWQQQANILRERRFGRAVPVEMREKARQLRFLQYRGFSGAQAGKALRCDPPEDY